MAVKKKQFKPSVSAETQFARALRKIGRISGHMVESHVDGATLHNQTDMQAALKAYSTALEPWAKRQAEKMLAKVSKDNTKAYKLASKEVQASKRNSREMGKLLRKEVAEKEVGRVAGALMIEQVELIKSIPLKAGMRAQYLAAQAVLNGTRASEIAEALMRSSKVSESQATLIARTEVARANASFTQARAQSVGARGYIWRTTMDGAERESHREMNGKYIEYANPPTLSDGMSGHAGTFPNCRCYQDVQFDEE